MLSILGTLDPDDPKPPLLAPLYSSSKYVKNGVGVGLASKATLAA
jgi:hypothetical protein